MDTLEQRDRKESKLFFFPIDIIIFWFLNAKRWLVSKQTKMKTNVNILNYYIT